MNYPNAKREALLEDFEKLMLKNVFNAVRRAIKTCSKVRFLGFKITCILLSIKA